jgi:hypothetical protein
MMQSREHHLDRLLQELSETSRHVAHAARMMQSLVHTQLNDARTRVDLYAFNASPDANGITVGKNTINTIVIETVLIIADSGAGALTLSIGKQVLPPLANPAGSPINLRGLKIPVGNGDAISLTAATPNKALYMAVFGRQEGDSYIVG